MTTTTGATGNNHRWIRRRTAARARTRVWLVVALLLGLLPVVAARLVLTAWDAGVGGVAGAGGQDVEVVGARPRRDTVGVLGGKQQGAALAGRLLVYASYQVSRRLEWAQVRFTMVIISIVVDVVVVIFIVTVDTVITRPRQRRRRHHPHIHNTLYIIIIIIIIIIMRRTYRVLVIIIVVIIIISITIISSSSSSSSSSCTNVNVVVT